MCRRSVYMDGVEVGGGDTVFCVWLAINIECLMWSKKIIYDMLLLCYFHPNRAQFQYRNRLSWRSCDPLIFIMIIPLLVQRHNFWRQPPGTFYIQNYKPTLTTLSVKCLCTHRIKLLRLLNAISSITYTPWIKSRCFSVLCFVISNIIFGFICTR